QIAAFRIDWECVHQAGHCRKIHDFNLVCESQLRHHWQGFDDIVERQGPSKPRQSCRGKNLGRNPAIYWRGLRMSLSG
ncbi:MAG TPA: hypothetical protein VK419_02130, partial [Bryobacteraceae bacterium]|nr:hypothetical protein [Bryobacteraceae bacterium]